ncbi:unnamed protein product, partial [Amoebophrya sp. A25]
TCDTRKDARPTARVIDLGYARDIGAVLSGDEVAHGELWAEESSTGCRRRNFAAEGLKKSLKDGRWDFV